MGSFNIRRGDIFYIERFQTVGSEQYSGRPAVVVSNDDNNKHSGTIEVVYLTTQPKENLPTHACVRSCMRDSIAICEQITTVALERVGNYKGHVTDEEMENIESAMLVSLDLITPVDETELAGNCGCNDVVGYSEEELDKIEELTKKLRESETRYEMLQKMYDSLLNKVVKVG